MAGEIALLLLSVAAVASAAGTSQSEAGRPVDLFVMAGQSNMQGWQGDAKDYPADPRGVDKAIRFYWVTPGHSPSQGQWTSLMAQGGRFPKGHFGPEVGFARQLKSAGLNPAIFKPGLFTKP